MFRPLGAPAEAGSPGGWSPSVAPAAVPVQPEGPVPSSGPGSRAVAWEPPPPSAPPPYYPPPATPPFGATPGPAPSNYGAPPERGGRKTLVIGLVVGALALAGTGVGFTLANRAPSKAEYVASAEQVCAPANAEVAAVTRPTSYPELASATGTVAAAMGTQATALRDLERPRDGGAALDAALVSLDSSRAAVERLGAAAGSSDDGATVAASNEVSAAFADASTKAAAFGFTGCVVGMKAGFDSMAGGSHGILKTAYVARAEGFCRSAASRMDAVPFPTSATPAALARFLGQFATIADQLLADLKGITVPPGDEAAVADMLAAQEQVNAKGHELIAAVRADDEAAFIAVDRDMVRLVTAADAKLDAYGLTVCGSNFGEY